MNNDHLIIWQKWHDPFGDRDESMDFDNNEFDNFIDDNEENIIDEEHNKIPQPTPIKKELIKVVATPMGIVPMNEHTASGKIFNFWVGHTNFDITKNIFNIIETTIGVECLDIFTRYRFRIAIGKAFNDSSVMKEIQETIYEYLNNIYETK